MGSENHQKVTASHLARTAYLYVRQSTLHQVVENTESTKRQYALRQRAVALGWPIEQVEVIDSDLGQSGASAADREGFQRLVAEVGMGKAGIVMGLEVSRLARNSMDWHRLLEMCALSDTLILDEDGLYDPQHFNDRLLLGLKGAMSEAELHLLRARLRGGLLSKAQRGELRVLLPIGLVYNDQGEVALDPDQQIQKALHLFFQTYRRTGSAFATVKALRKQGLLFPRRLRQGPRKGELVWEALVHSRALQLLHNPRYAGAYFFGRHRIRKTIDGKAHTQALPQDQWHTLLPGAHVGYISWQEYQENQRRLKGAAPSYGADRRKSPPREGPALLQGLVMCGVCGRRMTLRYHQRCNGLVPDYVCQREGIETGKPICQHIPGAAIDEAVGELVIEAVTPLALEVALHVQDELQARLEQADRLRQEQVQRARYEAEVARRRYMQVDPDNRLVADSLEADWNDKLRALTQAQEKYEQGRQTDRVVLDEKQRERILSLATDFPRLWRDPKTPQRERKRMIRLILEDVTLIKHKQITVHVRFKGGATLTKALPLPQRSWQTWTTDPKIVQEIDQLLDQYTHGQIAAHLNQRGLRSGKGQAFDSRLVSQIRHRYKLKGRYKRLRERGMLTRTEMAQRLGVAIQTVSKWRRHDLLAAHRYDDGNGYLYEAPGDAPPQERQGQELTARRAHQQNATQCAKEVQYAT